MEGLIPYLIDVIKKQHHKSPNRTYHRSFSHSDSSNGRSYHLLLGSSDSFGGRGGSSHRRTRSDLPPSVTAGVDFSEQRYGKDGFLSAASTTAEKSAVFSHASRLVSRNSSNVRKF